MVFERASSGLSMAEGNWIGLPFFVSDDNVSTSGRGRRPPPAFWWGGGGGQWRGWGHARDREIRLGGEARRRLRPRRAVCSGCGQTQVLLPAWVLARRADGTGVIGEALALAAAGLGHRTIAGRLGRAATTVRGWLRRLAFRAEALRSAFTALACELDPDPLLPGPSRAPADHAVCPL